MGYCNRIGRWKRQEWRDQLEEAIALFQVRDNRGLQQREGRGNAKRRERHVS